MTDTPTHAAGSPAEPLILTLDIGTSSTRAMLFDAQARAVPGYLAQAPYQPRTSTTGSLEFEAETLFEAAVGVIDQLLAQAGPLASQIGGVAVDTLVTNILGVDADDRPVTPVYTYAATYSAPDAEELRQTLGSAGRAEAHDRTGCLVHAAYLPARFRWLARTQPDLLAEVSHWASIGEYL
jgi:gluconokinase